MAQGKENGWNLAEFSAALEAQRLSKEEQRKEFNKKLEEVGPVLFIPYEDSPEGHGLGWFRANGGFVAFRKYSNGYEMIRSGTLEDELIRKLYEQIPKETK